LRLTQNVSKFFGFIKKTASYGIEKYVSPPWAPHAYDFIILASLPRPREIILFVLQTTDRQLVWLESSLDVFFEVMKSGCFRISK
jgi:hypothetical protein